MMKYGFNDAFLAVHYKFITGKFTFNPGLSVHRYTTFNEQLSTKQDDNSLEYYLICLLNIRLRNQNL
jgi:hypothetical protein